MCVRVSCLVVSDSLQPHRTRPTRPLCPWDSPGKNTSGLPCPPPGDLLDPGIKPASLPNCHSPGKSREVSDPEEGMQESGHFRNGFVHWEKFSLGKKMGECVLGTCSPQPLIPASPSLLRGNSHSPGLRN